MGLLSWRRWLKSFVVKDRDPFTLRHIYLGFWWPDDAKSQGISSHGANIVLQEYSRSGTEGLTFMVLDDLDKINKTSFLRYPRNWCANVSPCRRHHNYVVHECHGVSNHQQINLFMLTIRKHQTPEILVPCEGNQPVTGEFPSQRTSNAESVSMTWRRYESIAIGLSW